MCNFLGAAENICAVSPQTAAHPGREPGREKENAVLRFTLRHLLFSLRMFNWAPNEFCSAAIICASHSDHRR